LHSFNHHQVPIFSTKSDEKVINLETDPDIIELDQKYKRPDRTVGLSMTESFEHIAKMVRKYSPFENGMTLLPFLLVEAKSAKGSASWQAILEQSALAIRTCLKLQTNLANESGQFLRPLVWYFAFIGAEWQLYMAIPESDETVCLAVVDLCHADVLSA
jgi:hypothetical protein